jgi:hypothetical protein
MINFHRLWQGSKSIFILPCLHLGLKRFFQNHNFIYLIDFHCWRQIVNPFHHKSNHGIIGPPPNFPNILVCPRPPITKRKGQIKKTSPMAYKSIKKSQTLWNPTINPITWFVNTTVKGIYYRCLLILTKPTYVHTSLKFYYNCVCFHHTFPYW